ncbi:hypothetical protein TNCT_445181 [Trichonephila clavata]|uniref:Uncharacterized protein n=1 Tax=Trichonephila clavata TaxID=2740835 RepID=A0A8X6FVP0_TRICU|nr:hypothetical protein TNCT_431711 [Trichonephila clavata]GFQ96442.1 hypothetical protein TNCT_445181 [Trichonephila clavata]
MGLVITTFQILGAFVRVNHQLCQYTFETHTQRPNNWIRTPFLLAARYRGSYIRSMDPYRTLELCHQHPSAAFVEELHLGSVLTPVRIGKN